MNLVAECTTMSAPSSSGRCRIGVAKVLSTTTTTPTERATSTTAAMSTTSRAGFVGDSMITMSAVRTALCRAGTSSASTST